MGGRGSGRYWHTSNTTTIEATKRIDIRYMRRHGLLRPDWTGSLNWTRRGEPAGEISYTCHTDRIVFNCRYRSGDSDWEPVEQIIYFDRTPCHIGGERLWFRCPRCRRRCEVLCLPSKWIACRKCHRLPYQSQCDDHWGRLKSRQQKLEEMLFGPKRKRWRKAKRERLLAELEWVASAADEAFVLAAADLLDDDEMRRILVGKNGAA